MTCGESLGNLFLRRVNQRAEFLQVGPRDELPVGPFTAPQQKASQVRSARQLSHQFGNLLQNRLRKCVDLLLGNIERNEADLAGEFLELKCVAHDDSVER